MNIIELYAIIFTGLLGSYPAMVLAGKSSRLLDSMSNVFDCYFRYPLVVQRNRMCVTRLELATFIIFIGCNVFVLAYPVPGLREASSRLAAVSAINLTPLFLGGRPSLILELSHIPIPVYYLVHHWVGRVALTEGLAHAGLAFSHATNMHVRISGAIVRS
jgi:hypothetical protein